MTSIMFFNGFATGFMFALMVMAYISANKQG